MALHLERADFHQGEKAIHALLRIPHSSNPTQVGLPARFALRVAASPLVAFGTLDDEGRPWTSVWGGEVGFTTPLEHGVLAVQSAADARYDPVAKSLFGTRTDGKLSDEPYHITREELERGGGRVMAGLSIDLATRDRVKLGGRLVAAKVDLTGEEDVAMVQMAMLVEESLGNCPKYLNKKTIHPHLPSPRLVSDMLPLPSEALSLLEKADLFFLSSTDGCTMDTNHRGGPPGFVRVISNDIENGTQLIYPEYSGNRLYQTLGNLHVRPIVGICVPDFETSDVLYLTGETKILMGSDASRLLPHTKLAVKIHVTAARLVRDGLPFRGAVVDYSPYNPPVRRVAGDSGAIGGGAEATTATKASVIATLKNRELLTPSIARFTFTLAPTTPTATRPVPSMWKPGQHVTLDFSEELDVGWSHMRDDDPASLNDDFVRTFTVSNEPGPGEQVQDGTEMQITTRRHGPATGLLWKWNLRVPLEVPVLGFGGEEEHRVPEVDDGKTAVFIAAGVGITPALGQAPMLLASGRRYRVLWSLRAGDVPLAEDVFRRMEGLAGRTTIFVTGEGMDENLERNLTRLGSKIIRRRMGQEDVLLKNEEWERKYYLCTAPEMLKLLLAWLEAKDVTYESFEY